jgi:hypothetical protein
MIVNWRQKDKDWEIAFGKDYRDEPQLQSFLTEYPAMIAFEDISEQILQPRVVLTLLPASSAVCGGASCPEPGCSAARRRCAA